MKRLLGSKESSGFTLPEMIVSMGVLGILGGVFFQVLNSGMILFAKNTAVNGAHHEARDGINRLTRDIHASISVPQLRDTNFAAVPSTPQTASGEAPMAAGVSFQNVSLGPQYIWKDPNNNKIMVKGTPNTPESPQAGMRVVAPLFGVEDDITRVTATPTQANHHNVWLANGGEDLIANKSSPWGTSTNKYSIIYYTHRMLYLVRNGRYVRDPQGPFTITAATAPATDEERFTLSDGSYIPSATGTLKITPATYTSGSAQRYRYEQGELRLYRQDYNGTATYWKYIATVANHISSPRPFYIPLTESPAGAWYQSNNSYSCYSTSSSNSTGRRFAGSPNTRYVGIKLTARDSASTNRNYASTATLLNTQVDYRSRIALYQ